MRHFAATSILLATLLAIATTPACAWLVNGTPMCIAANDQLDLVAASDGAGGAYLAWTDPRNGTYQVYALHVDANGNPVTGWPFNGLVIAPGAVNQTQPHIAVTAGGALVIDWHQGSQLPHATVTSGGSVTLVASPPSVIFAGAAHVTEVGSDGVAWVAWSTHGAGTAVSVWRQGWAAVKGLSPSELDTGVPTLTPDASGGMWIAWQELGSAGDALLLTHLQGNGATAPGSSAEGDTICGANGSQEGLVSVADGAGGAYFAWQDRRNGNPDVYATRITATAALAAGWTANGTAVCAAASPQTDVHIARDAGGGLWLAWDDQRAGSGDDDIYAMALSSDGQRRAGFPVNGAAVATGALTQIMPAIATHPDGTATIAWAQYTGGTRGFDIDAARLSQHGGISPGINGSGVSTFANDQLQPLVVPGPGSDALVFWTDQRDLQADLFGTRIALATPAAAGGPDAARFAITRVWPQPARDGHVQVRLALPDARAATLALYDVAGRRIGGMRTIAGAGAHDVTLDAGGAAPGLYFVRLARAGEAREARVVLAR